MRDLGHRVVVHLISAAITFVLVLAALACCGGPR